MPYTLAHATSESSPTQGVLIVGTTKTEATNLYDLASSYWRLDHNLEQMFNFGGPEDPHPDRHINNVGLMVLARSTDPERPGAYTSQIKVGGGAAFLGTPHNLIDATTFYPRLDWFGETSPATGEFWTWAELNTLEAGLLCKDPNAPANANEYDGQIDCSYLALVIDYGRRYEPCPHCCCCCLCFNPVILLTEGFISLVIPGEETQPYRNPRSCFRIHLTDNHPGDAPCFYTNEEEIDAAPPLPGGIFMGIDTRGMYWYNVGISMTAGNILADGCTAISFDFEIRFPDGSPFIVTLQLEISPDLVYCDPWHLSCGKSEEANISLNGLPLNPCGDIPDGGDPVTSVYRDFCDGNIFITCQPGFDMDTCKGSDLTSGSGSGLC